MIAYFDTSALIPLIIDEPASDACSRLWNEASRAISTRLVYPEARAALARAERIGRLTVSELIPAVFELGLISEQVDYIEITARVANTAGDLAQEHRLRGYDAVHLASAAQALDGELVFVTGDHTLAAAARAMGMAVALTTLRRQPGSSPV